MTKPFAAVLPLALLLAVPAFAADDAGAEKILGKWSTKNEAAVVEIARCGEKFCGKIISLKNPTYAEIDEKTGEKDPEAGKPLRDRENPDEKLQKRSLIGLPMLEGFVYAGDEEWEDGTIYDPGNGKTYKCIIKTAEGGKVLKVRGYIGISLLGRTELWKRVN